MEIIICENPTSASRLAALHVAAVIRAKPEAVLGLATGATPVALYAELAELFRRGMADFSRCSTFNLDEYVGIGRDHPASFSRFMREKLFRHINVLPENTRIPDGLAGDIPGHCAAYEKAISAAGGIDLQILGIGADGHIGFNEPSSSLASRTRLKTLTRKTREDNARFFGRGEPVPQHAITMGIGTIMEAREAVLLAFGEAKAQAVANAIEGPVSASNPASILQMHPRAVIFLDDLAAGLLQRSDYYREVFEQKPHWQRGDFGGVVFWEDKR